jgi:carboxylesterase
MIKTTPIFINKNSDKGVLMIHGFTSTPDEFKELAVYLADKGFTVSAPFVAGHGTSPEDLIKTNPEKWVDSVKESYLQLKEHTKKVFIIGNSFGSNLALDLVKDIEDKPSAIITLGAPIYLRWHKVIVCRLYSYGFLKKYYSKPPRLYRTDFTDMIDEVTYPKMPTKSVRQFLSFIKNNTKRYLNEVKIPALVVHSDTDPVVNPKSATYIYEHLGSEFKRIYWFRSKYHTATIDENRSELFNKILDFINEVIDNNKLKNRLI